MSEQLKPVKRALISVFDKTGAVELAGDLHAAGVELVSTGSTAARIAEAGVPVTKVEELTGFPEILDDRVKTLHPKVHAGLLADVRKDSHRDQLAELDIAAFDLLVGNLYPFAQTVASGAGFDDIVEKIDVGGPSMVRGAAKNHANVAVVVDPADYELVRAAIAAGGTTAAERLRLAAKAFAHLATYDAAVASWLAEQVEPESLPGFAALPMSKAADLRYGENPHQAAALYTAPGAPGLAQAEQLHGKAMSFNNYTDADAAWRAAHDFAEPCVAIIKHANPCGLAVGATIAAAHKRAHECDPVSAFGGVIAANGEIDAVAAAQIADVFTEVVVAPSFSAQAVEILTKKKNIRLLRAPEWNPADLEVKPVSGGVLVQRPDRIDADGDAPESWRLVTGAAADAATLADLAFAWRAVRAVKSNAILLAADGASVGVGMGQVNRVDSARLAVERAGADRAEGAVAASDAFFPFPDGLQILTEAGVKAVVQPGGSVRDEEVIAAADKAGVTMYFTGTRHFTH